MRRVSRSQVTDVNKPRTRLCRSASLPDAQTRMSCSTAFRQSASSRAAFPVSVMRDCQRAISRSLFRVQNATQLRLSNQRSVPLAQVVQPGGRLRASGLVFKKFGWLTATVLVIWDKRYAEAWCLGSPMRTVPITLMVCATGRNKPSVTSKVAAGGTKVGSVILTM